MPHASGFKITTPAGAGREVFKPAPCSPECRIAGGLYITQRYATTSAAGSRNELAVTRSNVVPDLRRDVVDIVSCDGKTVVSTFSLPHQIVATMAATQNRLEIMTLAVAAF